LEWGESRRADEGNRTPNLLLTKPLAPIELSGSQWAGRRWVEHHLDFPSSVGTPIEATNLINRFDRQLVAAGLPDRRFHDLRPTAAALLLAQGVGLNTVKEILGHSQIGITADTDGHIAAELHRDAATRMGALLDDLGKRPTGTGGGRTGGQQRRPDPK